MKLVTIVRNLCAVLALLAVSGAPALAEGWRVDQGQSWVRFAYIEDGVRKSGHFGIFSGGGHFDHRDPSAAQLNFEIDVDSIVLEDKLRTNFVKGLVWFDVEDYPTARYELISLRPQGGGRYLATGRLTIKDVTKTLQTPFTLEISSNSARATGRFEFNRYDFHVGDGGGFFEIGREVVVSFDLTASKR